MSTRFTDLLVLQDGISDRLRQARKAAGLLQADLAEQGKVSRATQCSYEAGTTEPTTTYLRNIQNCGIDLPFVLFDRASSELDVAEIQPGHLDWARLRTAFEIVEFFCLRSLPNCPSLYRWLMVEKLYTSNMPLSPVDIQDGAALHRSRTDFLRAFLSGLGPEPLSTPESVLAKRA